MKTILTILFTLLGLVFASLPTYAADTGAPVAYAPDGSFWTIWPPTMDKVEVETPEADTAEPDL